MMEGVELSRWLRQQSVCVTGGRGALGTLLVRRLLEGGAARVVTLDNSPLIPSPETAGHERSAETVLGSILNPSDLDRALAGCTTVFHLAALAHVGRSSSAPIDCFHVNAFGTAQVLEACRRSGVQRVLYVSTGHVYGVPKKLPLREEHPTAPLSVYAASKLAGEAVVQGYAASFGLACDIARLSNVYGSSFDENTVISTALSQAAAGGPVVLRDPTPVRDFIHVDDVVEALVRLAASPEPGERERIVNVSTGRGVSVRGMTQILAKLLEEGGRAHQVVFQGGSEHGAQAPRLILDNGRLVRRTGWRPEMRLERGLELALRDWRRQENNLKGTR